MKGSLYRRQFGFTLFSFRDAATRGTQFIRLRPGRGKPMRAKLLELSLTARVMIGAMAMIFVVAVMVTWFIVHKDREAYLADHEAILANGV